MNMNNIKVDFGDNVTSIFYWHEVDSLQTLKERISKRYKIHLDDFRAIKHNDNMLNEEAFDVLYKNRFTEGVKLKQKGVGRVKIDDALLSSIFSSSSSYTMPKDFKFKAKNSKRRISDLKHDLRSKSWLPTKEMILLINLPSFGKKTYVTCKIKIKKQNK